MSESSIKLWMQAEREHPDNRMARVARYLDLLRANGHLAQRQPGVQSSSFSCGHE